MADEHWGSIAGGMAGGMAGDGPAASLLVVCGEVEAQLLARVLDALGLSSRVSWCSSRSW
jgi:hypothetical protein